MNNNVVDFQRSKNEHDHKRKEAKVEKLRSAFAAARSEVKEVSRAARRREKHSKNTPGK